MTASLMKVYFSVETLLLKLGCMIVVLDFMRNVN